MAVVARIPSGCYEFRHLIDTFLLMLVQMHSGSVCCCASETRPVKKENEAALSHIEVIVIGWMYDVKLKDKTKTWNHCVTVYDLR